MQYRRLGKTNLMVSEIGFGGEWLERHEEGESVGLLKYAHSKGINILDCWMPDPKSRDIIGQAIEEDRGGWYVQGHVGSTYQNGQYTRTRDAEQCRIAFEDLLDRLRTDYIDLGMIHYVDLESDWETVSRPGPYRDYVMQLKAQGTIRHIGLSTHNPVIARKAAESGLAEMILFSVNPAFDLMPPTDNLENYFADTYADGLNGVDPVRVRMYKICEQQNVGITCMKPFAGGRLFDAKRSPFGVALTPVQCIHYALTKPGVASVLCGYDTPDQVDAAVGVAQRRAVLAVQAVIELLVSRVQGVRAFDIVRIGSFGIGAGYDVRLYDFEAVALLRLFQVCKRPCPVVFRIQGQGLCGSAAEQADIDGLRADAVPVVVVIPGQVHTSAGSAGRVGKGDIHAVVCRGIILERVRNDGIVDDL